MICQTKVYIVAAKRTPTGGFNGSLASLTAPVLGSHAIKAALAASSINPTQIDEVFFGNVLSAGIGQNPARQASLLAGIPNTVPCTTINKVCASGMKSIMLGAQTIMCGNAGVVVVGGMESMSNTPYMLPKHRFGSKFGDASVVDGIVSDGLFDFENKCLMGNHADDTAKECGISRKSQDDYACSSYERSQAAQKAGHFSKEIAPVAIPQRGGKPDIIIDTDEEISNYIPDRLRKLKPAFDPSGTVTAANASTLSDGASCLILASMEKVAELGLTPLAEIIGFADASREPARFTLAPALALPKALLSAGIPMSSVEYWEINEAFSVVPLANAEILSLPLDKVNIWGGGVSQGHPLGSSGSRIVVTLINVLRERGASIGGAGVCNGGGGASSIVIQNCK